MKTRVKDIYNKFNGHKEDWDNNGVIIGDENAEINCILVAMDVTEQILHYCKENNVDLLITHHPLIFKPIKRIEKDSLVSKIINMGITYMSLHTVLDYSEYTRLYIDDFLRDHGLYNNSFVGFSKSNDLSDEIGFKFNTDYGINDISELFREFCGPRDFDSEPDFLFYGDFTWDDTKLKKAIGFSQGSGNHLVNEVLDSKLDLFVTGELSYHNILTLNNNDISVLLLGHNRSEHFLLDVLSDLLVCINNELRIISIKDLSFFKLV